MKINYEAGAGDTGGGGGAGTPPVVPDWRASIPEDIRNDPSLKDFKDPGSLAKSYLHTKSLVGADKVVKPQANWKQEQWDSFYNAVGRPETVDKYAFDPKMHEGMQVDDAKMAKVKETFHKAGLTQKQANEVMSYYFNSTKEQTTASASQIEQNRAAALADLQKEYGDTLPAKMNVANAVIRDFADDNLKALLQQEKWGDNPSLVRLFVKIGDRILEDSAQGSGSGLIVGDSAQALAEINSLKGDKDFLNVFTNRQAPGHKQAIEKWNNLYKIAYPQK